MDHRTILSIAPSMQWYRATLLVVIALCTYLSLPFAPGGRLLVPSYPTVALAPLLFLTVWSTLSKVDKVFLPKVAFVLFVSIALSPGYVYITEKFLSLIQCCMALAVTVMTIRLMQQMRLEIVERALFVLWLLIVVASILEVTGITRDMSDAFRVWAYDGVYTLYTSEERDLNLVGWPRPKVFSEEPSHATRIFIASINSWLIVRVTRTKVATVAIATATMFLVMGSPIIIVSAVITMAVLVWNHRASVQSRVVMVIAAVLIGTLFLAFYGQSTLSNVMTRIDRIGETTGSQQLRATSENLRLIVPYMTLAGIWSRWPLFGAGVGGKEVAMERVSLPGIEPRYVMGNNVMAELGIYLGFVGALWFVWVLRNQAAQTGVRRLGLLFLIGALASQLEGGMEAFRFWGFIALYWGALAVADTQPEEQVSVRGTDLEMKAVAAKDRVHI